MNHDHFIVAPGAKIRLKDYKPGFTSPSLARAHRHAGTSMTASWPTRRVLAPMKVPVTAKDHYEMAEHYQTIDAQTHRESEMHKKMLAEFSQGVAKNPKDREENPYIRNMRLRCENHIKAAKKFAHRGCRIGPVSHPPSKGVGGVTQGKLLSLPQLRRLKLGRYVPNRLLYSTGSSRKT